MVLYQANIGKATHVEALMKFKKTRRAAKGVRQKESGKKYENGDRSARESDRRLTKSDKK